MAARLSLLSLTQLQQLAQSEPATNYPGVPGSGDAQLVWNPTVRAPEELDDSWEVRAFAEDYTGSVSGSTWPPRCYTCTFCKREFRSAQALGGHMNVHRRDRATKRLHHQLPPPAAALSSASTSSSALVVPGQELANINRGLCVLYQLPPQFDAAMSSNWFPAPVDNNLLAKPSTSFTSSHAYSSKFIEASSAQISNCHSRGDADGKWNKDFVEDLDLELRLGYKPLPS
ncbi:hypothetical protein CDL15_Pgr018701 [Punica granatum]|uniref:C2H2-type domain-containing protein n=1 Tax=Punica granatum TaxID=22663 RepID=A0A218VVL0_PUNGR|nr:hypothetical protein CDL15_Pgr018701 [Punica granatum]